MPHVDRGKLRKSVKLGVVDVDYVSIQNAVKVEGFTGVSSLQLKNTTSQIHYSFDQEQAASKTVSPQRKADNLFAV